MSSRMFTAEQKSKLGQLFQESISILKEVEDLSAGLNDTIKNVALEMEIKPAVLKRAIKTAQRSKFTDVKADHEEMETILETVGRTI